MGNMMKTSSLAVCAALVAAMPVIAQHPADPDKMVAGSGTLPSGWKGRLDNGSATAAAVAGVKVMAMGTALHFVSGPAGIYFKSTDKPMNGSYDVEAAFTQLQPAAHPEAYGLFIGGSDLDGPNQKYTYFLIRQDGRFLVKRRAGNETPTVANWTESAAIKKADPSGKMSNTLAIHAAKDKVHFLVNGTEVSSVDPAQVDTNGIAGLRVNHNLSVTADGFTIKAH